MPFQSSGPKSEVRRQRRGNSHARPNRRSAGGYARRLMDTHGAGARTDDDEQAHAMTHDTWSRAPQRGRYGGTHARPGGNPYRWWPAACRLIVLCLPSAGLSARMIRNLSPTPCSGSVVCRSSRLGDAGRRLRCTGSPLRTGRSSVGGSGRLGRSERAAAASSSQVRAGRRERFLPSVACGHRGRPSGTPAVPRCGRQCRASTRRGRDGIT
jgi:hypothetical protein